MTCDFQQCGILTSTDSHKPIIEYSMTLRLLSLTENDLEFLSLKGGCILYSLLLSLETPPFKFRNSK